MVHRREIDGQELVLGNHGALWGNAMTWFDHGTGSVWSQPLGQAILGPLKGERLELLPSTLTTWGDWLELHPDSLALSALSSRSGFDLDMMAVVVEFGPESAAFPVPDVRLAGVANATIGSVPVAVTVDAEGQGDNWTVLSRTLDDEVVDLVFDQADGVLREADTDGDADGGADTDGRSWNPSTGLGLNGTDQNLDQLPGFTSFPADYVTFFPDGALWTDDGLKPVS
jgi:hypothetical protein